ncbi:type VI secretion system-associated protein VasI [Dyella terrae]|uniref:type VI secretion system-associated protein VasI n=1 Tax=Dyella terrae TaxID=522259 RepID=UPI001EFDDD92|nr:type VI secretion system-associated protein VasI [Dyella terrae]ULU26646.1 type VI secretion system-associated protein TagO [Dyella terrae]
MKPLFPCLLMLGLAACNHDDNAPSLTATPQTPDCTKIMSGVQRLACFDTVAHTPVPLAATASSSTAPANAGASTVAIPSIVGLVQRNEAMRKAEDHHFLLSRSRENSDNATQIVISAPALGSDAPRPVLAISCLSGITRLQFITAQSIPHNRIRMRLLMDDAPVADAAPWQVLDVGTITDAGRGLVAIDTLKRMPSGSRLQTESDYAPLDGLIFDATDLRDLIAQQREACHW